MRGRLFCSIHPPGLQQGDCAWNAPSARFPNWANLVTAVNAIAGVTCSAATAVSQPPDAMITPTTWSAKFMCRYMWSTGTSEARPLDSSVNRCDNGMQLRCNHACRTIVRDSAQRTKSCFMHRNVSCVPLQSGHHVPCRTIHRRYICETPGPPITNNDVTTQPNHNTTHVARTMRCKVCHGA